VKTSFSANAKLQARLSVRQFDSVGMFLVALVLFGKNLFEPFRLLFRNQHIHRRGIVAYKEILAANVTLEGSHLLETYGFLSATLLYGHCLHVLFLGSSSWIMLPGSTLGTCQRAFFLSFLLWLLARQHFARHCILERVLVDALEVCHPASGRSLALV
jgi:hypothetical protein